MKQRPKKIYRLDWKSNEVVVATLRKDENYE